MGCVYKIVSPSGRIYIGKTMDANKRFSNYRCLSCKAQKKLYNSFVKYGFTSHVITILMESESEADLLKEEVRLISLYETLKSGLNMTQGGEGFSGRKHSYETKVALRNLKLGTKASQETKRKIGLKSKGNKYSLGRTLSVEHKEKLSIAHTGKLCPKSEADRKKISEGRKGIAPFNKGKRLSEKHYASVLEHNRKKQKPIIRIDSSGNILAEYESLISAAAILNISKGNISNCCTGRCKKTNGMYFKFAS